MDHMPSHCFKKTGGWLSWFRTNDLGEGHYFNIFNVILILSQFLHFCSFRRVQKVQRSNSFGS